MARSTREQWATRVARWKESGRTAREFASEIGVRADTLKWWSWRLGSKSARRSTKRALTRPSGAVTNAPSPEISPLTFVEMTAAIDIDRLEVVLPTSVRVRVRPGFDAPTLGRLLDVLEARR